ncbi:hypothetical protein KC329_g31 [Hortaea werneckii]|nr:hypothetical protein KC329_g31 [Hortaea werneckii]
MGGVSYSTSFSTLKARHDQVDRIQSNVCRKHEQRSETREAWADAMFSRHAARPYYQPEVSSLFFYIARRLRRTNGWGPETFQGTHSSRKPLASSIFGLSRITISSQQIAQYCAWQFDKDS